MVLVAPPAPVTVRLLRHPPGSLRPRSGPVSGRSPVPVTVCWAAKGGSGTTVVAATIALACPTDSLLVDLDGELPAVLGLPEPAGQGVADWLVVRCPARRPRRPRRRRRPHDPAHPPRVRASRSTGAGSLGRARRVARRAARHRSSTPAPPAPPVRARRRRPQPARHPRLLPRAAPRRGRRRAGPTASCSSPSRGGPCAPSDVETRGRRRRSSPRSATTRPSPAPSTPDCSPPGSPGSLVRGSCGGAA